MSLRNVSKLVNCFTVYRPHGNEVGMDIVHNEFGGNLPKYCIYDGCMTGCVYLCCVDTQVDVQTICEKHGYELHTLYQMEIPDEMYNDQYTVYPTYKREGPQYKLESRSQ